MWVNVWLCVCVCVCVHLCVCACVRDREREREQYILRYAHWQKEQMKYVNFLHVSIVQDHYQSEKSIVIQHRILQLRQEVMLWYSTQGSQRHMQLPELKAWKQPMLIIKLALRRFNTFFQTCHGLVTFWKCAAYAERTCTLCFLARGSTLANWLTVIC